MLIDLYERNNSNLLFCWFDDLKKDFNNLQNIQLKTNDGDEEMDDGSNEFSKEESQVLSNFFD